MNDVDFDFERQRRVGLPEIVYGEHKSVEQLTRIIELCLAESHPILVSRLQPEKADLLCQSHGGDYHPVGRTWLLDSRAKALDASPRVAVVSAGTADAPVVAECETALHFLQVKTLKIQDVGVAGIHRLLRRLDEIRACDVVVCVAGFEGTLPSVIAGQVAAPVIGVPTSVGYGVSAGGHAALNAMLASCASGLLVMNIDNGIGAALAAKRILPHRRNLSRASLLGRAFARQFQALGDHVHRFIGGQFRQRVEEASKDSLGVGDRYLQSLGIRLPRHVVVQCIQAGSGRRLGCFLRHLRIPLELFEGRHKSPRLDCVAPSSLWQPWTVFVDSVLRSGLPRVIGFVWKWCFCSGGLWMHAVPTGTAPVQPRVERERSEPAQPWVANRWDMSCWRGVFTCRSPCIQNPWPLISSAKSAATAS